MGPRLDSKRGAGEPGVVAERRHPPPTLVLQELQVVQRALARWEAREHLCPAALVLVAVRELHMRVLEREGVFGELLEAQDYVALGSV